MEAPQGRCGGLPCLVDTVFPHGYDCDAGGG